MKINIKVKQHINIGNFESIEPEIGVESSEFDESIELVGDVYKKISVVAWALFKKEIEKYKQSYKKGETAWELIETK